MHASSKAGAYASSESLVLPRDYQLNTSFRIPDNTQVQSIWITTVRSGDLEGVNRPQSLTEAPANAPEGARRKYCNKCAIKVGPGGNCNRGDQVLRLDFLRQPPRQGEGALRTVGAPSISIYIFRKGIRTWRSANTRFCLPRPPPNMGMHTDPHRVLHRAALVIPKCIGDVRHPSAAPAPSSQSARTCRQTLRTPVPML